MAAVAVVVAAASCATAGAAASAAARLLELALAAMTAAEMVFVAAVLVIAVESSARDWPGGQLSWCLLAARHGLRWRPLLAAAVTAELRRQREVVMPGSLPRQWRREPQRGQPWSCWVGNGRESEKGSKRGRAECMWIEIAFCDAA
ncbi:unnamed protein product [Phaeothamnion confervicola]